MKKIDYNFALSTLKKTDARLVESIVNCRSLQRLKYIKQLGFAYLAFPSADQTRFDHSISTFSIVCSVLTTVGKQDSFLARHLLAISLLQDIGHCPFSNSLTENFLSVLPEREPFSPPDIQRTQVILKWLANNEVFFGQERLDVDILLSFLNGSSPWSSSPWVTHLLNSVLDADRLAYVPDDFSIVKNGRIDVANLVGNIVWNHEGHDVVIDEQAQGPVSQFVFSRADLYASVYLHPIKLAIEHLASEFLGLLWDGEFSGILDPSFLEPRTVESFIKWTDATVIAAVKFAAAGKASTRAKRLATMLLSGRLQVADLHQRDDEDVTFDYIDSCLKEFSCNVKDPLFYRILFSRSLPNFKIYSPKSIFLKEKHTYVPIEARSHHLQNALATGNLARRPILIFDTNDILILQRELQGVSLKMGSVLNIKSINGSIIS